MKNHVSNRKQNIPKVQTQYMQNCKTLKASNDNRNEYQMKRTESPATSLLALTNTLQPVVRRKFQKLPRKICLNFHSTSCRSLAMSSWAGGVIVKSWGGKTFSAARRGTEKPPCVLVSLAVSVLQK
nr:hypothetical protein Iba_chr11fCG3890 [Ipomoea batatas]